MNKSMLSVLFLSSILALTGCNQDIKEAQTKLESTYNIQLDVQKQNGKYVIISTDFYTLSEVKQYDLLLDMYSYYKQYAKSEIGFGVESNGSFYTLSNDSKLPVLKKDNITIYSRTITQTPKVNPYNEEQMIDLVKERLGSTLAYSELFVIGDNVTGKVAGKWFVGVFDVSGELSITILS